MNKTADIIQLRKNEVTLILTLEELGFIINCLQNVYLQGTTPQVINTLNQLKLVIDKLNQTSMKTNEEIGK